MKTQRRLDERELRLELDEAARTWLIDRGYDPAFGARPLRRVIRQELENPLAEKLPAGECNPGDAVRVGMQDGALTLQVEAAAPETETAAAG